MQILKTNGWEDYELFDSGEGYRLERFGKFNLVKPDPQAIWKRHLPSLEWQNADATFVKEEGKERWINKNHVPNRWLMQYKELSFWAELSPFKHTGVFPEQVINWEWMDDLIKNAKSQTNILNLFAYTGIASLVAAAAGAKVTHVDASKPTIGWARENQKASKLEDKPIRWILDDAVKFTQREIKRGVKYDGIIMDPPVFGHGPTGERWEFNQSFPELVDVCRQVLSDNPLFVLINAYAISSSAIMLENVMNDMMKDYNGTIEVGELALEERTNKRLLSTGIYGRWQRS